MGEHKGFWFYTIGQRQGIGLSGGPWYVVAKDSAKNHVIISRNYDSIDQAKQGMVVKDMHLLSCDTLPNRELDVKFRHGPQMHKANVEVKKGEVVITLKEQSSQGIAVGQFAVLYDGEICLGGGVIDEVF